MDDLTFRKLIAGGKPEVNDASQALSPGAKKLAVEMTQMTEQVNQALTIDPPDSLLSDLLQIPDYDEQSDTIKKTTKPSNMWILSLAASVVLAFSFLLLQPYSEGPFTQSAFKHAMHQHPIAQPISLDVLNNELSSVGATLTNTIGKVYFAKYCELNGQSIMHIMMLENGQPLSIYMLPVQSSESLDSRYFRDMYGTPMEKGSRQLYLIGHDKKTVDKLSEKLTKELNFTI